MLLSGIIPCGAVMQNTGPDHHEVETQMWKGGGKHRHGKRVDYCLNFNVRKFQQVNTRESRRMISFRI